MNHLKKDIILSALKASPLSVNSPSLAPLSCDISSGEIVFLVGLEHSITLAYLHMLACIEPPQSGRITLSGENCLEIPADQQSLLRTKLGFVMQSSPLLSVVNGLENLKLPARYHQLGDELSIQQKAEDLLAAMPDDFDNQLLPAFMSDLQRRLLSIARPLMLNPQILFLDNPFDGLGHHDKVIVSKYITNLIKDKSLSLVVNSDDLYFAHRHANQIIFCDENVMTFNTWQDFYHCKQESIALLFEKDNIIRNV